MPQTSGLTHINQFVELCTQAGLRKVVLSPGSRNAPLIIAFEAHPSVETFLVHDERSAGFFAIGLAESSNEAVAICSTSGSAPLNYAPAVAEAYYRQIPLMILSADRPPELVDQGDGQTIRQKGIYSNFIKDEFELPCVRDGQSSDESNSISTKALNCLITGVKGPVHLNIPLAEPLYLLEESVTELSFEGRDQSERELSSDELSTILDGWNGSQKRMILIGQMNAHQNIPDSLKKLIEDPSVAVLVENCSNVQSFNHINHCIDRTLAAISDDEIEKYRPDLLITIGGAVISKRIKKFFRNQPPAIHWRVGEYLFEEDCFHCLSQSFDLKLAPFFEAILKADASNSTYGNLWKQLDFECRDKHENFLSNAGFSDLKAFEIMLSSIPENSELLMGNSSAVRYCQLFDPVASLHYHSNRGVSGIDGCSSTAVGMSNGNDRLHTLISGDTSFFYDSNAFWNSYLKSNLRLIVVNNGGGGIFEFIPGPNDSGHLSSFVAPHEGNIEGICKAFGLDYTKAASESELESSFHDFFQEAESGRPKVLEVYTADCPNSEMLRKYFEVLGVK